MIGHTQQMNASRSILWFRRDLRLNAHPALQRATRDGDALALFVIDPLLIRSSGAARIAFLYRTLRELSDATDGALVIRTGEPSVVISALAEQLDVTEVVVTRDYAPYGRRRDAAVNEALAGAGRSLVGVGSPYAVAPGTVRKADGAPYAVFTPFSRAWRQHLPDAREADARATDVRWLRGVESEPLAAEPTIGARLPPAGEVAAHLAWQVFKESGLDAYDQLRDRPGVAGTSGLSPYLRWGVIHPTQLLSDLGTEPAHEVFRSELAWREFYADVLFHQPATARNNLQTKMNAMAIDDGDVARRRFDRWCAGQTGYPIVDAGMRQLLATGWMHNRVRMIVASFLVKDLHLPWQWGARHFMRHLVDGDLASNQHGWQWAAGTGTDAAPYFRVFNPITQSQRFDPDGAYIRRWVKELHDTPTRFVHAPWTQPEGTPPGISSPMIDHATERDVALTRYQQAMGR
jgi:deoxyribodipyrimidine photo-lyase